MENPRNPQEPAAFADKGVETHRASEAPRIRVNELTDLVFIPNDYHTKTTDCECGCPPSADADVVVRTDWDLFLRDDIVRIRKGNFLVKSFVDYNDDEKRELKARITDYLTYYPANKRIPEKRLIKDNHFQIEELFKTVMMFSSLISIKDFLNFMGWTPEKNPREFYICLEEVLDNSVYPNGRNWRNQSTLLAQVRVFFDEFHANSLP